MQRQSGFTLLEILLVVVIIALSASLVVQTIPVSQEDHIKFEVNRFYQRLKLMSDDAILQGKDFGVRIDEQQNRLVYMKYAPEGWQEIETVKQFTPTQIDEDVELLFEIGSNAWADDDRLFNNDSLFNKEIEVESSFEDETKLPDPPTIFVLSSGDITPFQLAFIIDSKLNANENWRVIVSEIGEIKLLAPGELIGDLNEG